ncbi:serine/threonine protein kinase [Pseudomonas sp. HN11]|uniref:serine/threonine-protein kinase n=1 Tax=Pseudomonas sp. HN11 TaxID=1344094 RepID=UPI001F33A8E1|nr:serine/threonine-protein kinase [Pseudomonas sp. HN11]UII74023.1 serine/threonine protein kinase [Pseudomonas sp. HN11]
MKAVEGLPNLLAGRYQLERILGTGGMGVVYRARDLLHEAFGEPDCRVALKMLGETLSASTDAHVLLYSEFALTRSLLHEHVVRAFSFEVDTVHKRAFFTMEVMRGLTLDRLLPQWPLGLAWQALQPMALQLLDALAYTHRQGVLHGDVKPANIMVGEQGLRLFDFGLGHAEAQARVGLPCLSRNRLNAWTPAYAAPELIAGELPSTSTDVYGVACVLYELAEGRRPGERQCNQRLSRPRHLPRHCWPTLCSALAMDPEYRTVCVAELREALAGRRRCWSLG